MLPREKGSAPQISSPLAARTVQFLKQNRLVILLLATLFLLNWLSVRNKSLTYNEIEHFFYGLQILHLDSDRGTDDSKMPFNAFNALPIFVSQIDFEERSIQEVKNRATPLIKRQGNLNIARLATMMFSLLLGVYVFSWAKEIYGFHAGIFSLFIYVFSPNIIAHSRLVTTDLYAACMITISCYHFWKFVNKPDWSSATKSAFALGASQLAKYSCIYLYPVFVLVLATRSLVPAFQRVRGPDPRSLPVPPRAAIKFAAYFLVISLLTINIGFLFKGTLQPFGAYRFRSDTFKALQKTPLLKDIPIPLPAPYVEGLDRCRFRERTGHMFGLNYLLGELNPPGKAFAGYYFIAYLLKVPIAIQILLLMAIIAYFIKTRRGAASFLKNELFLVVPVLFFTVYFNFFFRAQMGIRHFIVVLPLLHVFIGGLLSSWKGVKWTMKGCVIALSAYLVVSVASYFPHYISYFNELIWDRKMAYKYLADSCLDIGQNERYVQQYLDRNPQAHFHPESPVEGTVVVGVNWLTGIMSPFDPGGRRDYKWLRENFEPVDHIAYTHLVFKIPKGSLKRLSVERGSTR